jgi:hypothetical protein
VRAPKSTPQFSTLLTVPFFCPLKNLSAFGGLVVFNRRATRAPVSIVEIKRNENALDAFSSTSFISSLRNHSTVAYRKCQAKSAGLRALYQGERMVD